MRLLSYFNKSRVIVTGPIIGQFADFADDVVAKDHNTLFISIGSSYLGCGSGLRQDLELEYLQGICERYDNELCLVRGAFDDSMYFNTESFKSTRKGLYDILKNIHFLEDYDVISTKIGDILCIGGASRIASSASNGEKIETGVTRVNPSKVLERVESSKEGEDEVLEDINPFTSFLSGKKINYVVAPLAIASICDGLDDKSLEEDISFVTSIYDETLDGGAKIKKWLFNKMYEKSSSDTSQEQEKFEALENFCNCREIS